MTESDRERIRSNASNIETVLAAASNEIRRSRKAWPNDPAISGARSALSLLNMFEVLWEIAFDASPDDEELVNGIREVRKLSVAVMDHRMKATGRSDLLNTSGSGRGPLAQDGAIARINAAMAAEILILAGETTDNAWDRAAERLVEQGWANFEKLGLSLRDWRYDNFGRNAWEPYKRDFDKRLSHYNSVVWTGRPEALNREAERLLRSISQKK